MTEAITLHIDGMTCGSCAEHVKQTLEKVPGVRSADFIVAVVNAEPITNQQVSAQVERIRRQREALLKAVRERTQLAVQRNDFKLEQLSPHLFMNFRVVDEQGRLYAHATTTCLVFEAR